MRCFFSFLFDSNLSQWLYNASSFNQVLCWDISNVRDIEDMFTGSRGSLSPDPSCLGISPNRTMTDDNIFFAAYQWVTNYTSAFIAHGDIRFWDVESRTMDSSGCDESDVFRASATYM